MENNNTSNNDKSFDNTEVGALWKRQARGDGQVYLAGHVRLNEDSDDTTKVVVFTNKHKKSEKAPDYRIYLSKPMSQASSSEDSGFPENKTTQQETEELV
tara:strand:+ start:20515 stop:20814 length:300 start_codon:yes stop_codon:yes gene_type:complete